MSPRERSLVLNARHAATLNLTLTLIEHSLVLNERHSVIWRIDVLITTGSLLIATPIFTAPAAIHRQTQKKKELPVLRMISRVV